MDRIEVIQNIIDKKKAKSYLEIGVNNGDSFFPISKYNKLYNDQGIGTNVVQLIGHGTIRKEVIGYSDKKVSKEDINEIISPEIIVMNRVFG